MTNVAARSKFWMLLDCFEGILNELCQIHFRSTWRTWCICITLKSMKTMFGRFSEASCILWPHMDTVDCSSFSEPRTHRLRNDIGAIADSAFRWTSAPAAELAHGTVPGVRYHKPCFAHVFKRYIGIIYIYNGMYDDGPLLLWMVYNKP